MGISFNHKSHNIQSGCCIFQACPKSSSAVIFYAFCWICPVAKIDLNRPWFGTSLLCLYRSRMNHQIKLQIYQHWHDKDFYSIAMKNVMFWPFFEWNTNVLLIIYYEFIFQSHENWSSIAFFSMFFGCLFFGTITWFSFFKLFLECIGWGRVCSLTLTFIMGQRYLQTFKIMPAGVVAVLRSVLFS